MTTEQQDKPKYYGLRIEEHSPHMTSGYNVGNISGYSITEAIYKYASQIKADITIYAGGTATWQEGDTICQLRAWPTPNVTVA